MNVVWSKSAQRNLDEIVLYIALDNPAAAMRIDDLIVASTARLRDFPASGKPGAIAGTRELVPHPSYRVVYEHDERMVRILAVVHTPRQWPPVVGEDG